MTQRVLVVDDDQTVSDVIRRYLENDGFQVSLAADGEAALAAVQRQAPHLVVLDLMLPGSTAYRCAGSCEPVRMAYRSSC